jgi:hypothetical protein
MFSGLSTLRKEEKKEPAPQNKALQDYLKKYTDGGGDGAGDKKKKRKKRPKPEAAGAVQIVDGDLTGFEAIQAAAEVKRRAAAAGGPLPGADDGSGDDEGALRAARRAAGGARPRGAAMRLDSRAPAGPGSRAGHCPAGGASAAGQLRRRAQRRSGALSPAAALPNAPPPSPHRPHPPQRPPPLPTPRSWRSTGCSRRRWMGEGGPGLGGGEQQPVARGDAQREERRGLGRRRRRPSHPCAAATLLNPPGQALL